MYRRIMSGVRIPDEGFLGMNRISINMRNLGTCVVSLQMAAAAVGGKHHPGERTFPKKPSQMNKGSLRKDLRAL